MSFTPPPLPSHRPPPLPSTGRGIFEQCARASWISLILAFAINIGLTALGKPAQGARESSLISVIFMGALALIGVTAGIVALCGVARHGSRRILWPAITGVGLWVLLFAVGVPVFLVVKRMALLNKRAVLTPALHTYSGRRIENAEFGFAFDLPEGYEPASADTTPKGYLYVFRRGVPGESNRVVTAKSLGGVLGRARVKPEELPAGKSIILTSFNWRGLEVDGFRVPEKLGTDDYVTFNVQIPLKKQGIQFGFGGSARAEAETRAVVNQVLASLEGEAGR